MSKAVNSSIDERIVEMKFDNKQFESGVKQTMSTIDRLKESLQFNNDVKGIDNIQNSINKINFNVAMSGIESFQQKLSALQIFGKRIVENLADDFYGAIKKVENGIKGVFNQISTGGANRALNIEQAKFQLEGLHIAWEDIKGDIDYAVSGTAYGLDAAAKVAAQLSASQIEVGDDMKNALRGISGVAAMTNSSYEDIGRVFTQVAGAGRLYTQDMLQLSSRGLNVAAALATQLGKTEGEIREMVTKGQIDFKTFSTAMNEAFGEQATKANDTYTGSLSNVKAALSRIGADIKAGHFETLRQVFVDLIPKINEFKKAFKPVENVIIEVEAAVGKLLQKIISMVDVTKIVEKIGKPVEAIGKKILDAVNVISEALGEVNRPMEAMKEFAYMSREAAMSLGGFGDSVKYVTDAEEENVEMSEDMANAFQAAKDIWNTGKYGNGQARIDALTAAGIDPEKTQAIIEEFIRNGYDWDAAIQKVTESTSDAVEENTAKAEKLRATVQKLAAIFSNIKRIIKNVATSVSNVLSALVKSVSGSMEDLGVGDILVNVTGTIADISDKLVITKEKAEELTKPVKFLLDILKTVVKISAKIIGAIGKIIFNIGKLVYTLGSKILASKDFNNFFSAVSESFTTLGKNIKNLIIDISKSESLQKFFNTLKTIGSTAIRVFAAFILKIGDILNFVITKIKSFGEIIASFFDFKSNNFDTMIENIEVTTDKFGFFKHFIINMVKTLRNVIKSIANSMSSLFSSASDGSFGLLLDDIRNKITEFMGKARNLLNTVVDWITSFITMIIDRVKSLTGGDIHNLIKDSLLTVVIADAVKIYRGLSKIIDGLPKMISGVSEILSSTAKVNKSIARLNTAKVFTEIGKTVLMFAASLTLIVGSIVTLAEYIERSDKSKAAFDYALVAVSDIMGKVALVILSWIALTKVMDLATSVFTSKTRLHIPVFIQMASFIFSIGYTLKAIVHSISSLGKIDPLVLQTGKERLIDILKIMGVFFTVLSLVAALINRFIGGGTNDATKGLYAISLVVLSIAASIDLLVIAIAAVAGLNKLFGAQKVELAIKYIGNLVFLISACLFGLFTSLSFFRSLGQTQDIAKVLLSVSSIFVAIALAFDIMIPALLVLAGMIKFVPEETFISISVVGGLLVEIMLLAAIVASNANKNSAGLMKNVALTIVAFIGLVWELQNLADHIQSREQMYTVVGSLLGLAAIVLAMSQLVKNLGSNKLKWQNLLSLAGVFASLSSIVLSMYFLTEQPWENILSATMSLAVVVFAMQYVMRSISKSDTKYSNILALAVAFTSLSLVIAALYHVAKLPVENIVASMLGLSLVITTMSILLERLNNTNVKFSQILSLGVAFAGLTTMLLPLALLKGEDWAGYLAAMGGLAAVVLVFSAVIDVLSTTTTAPQLIAIGGAIGIMAAGLSVLGLALGWISKQVDIEGLVAVTLSIASLATVITILGAVVAKMPIIGGGILVITAALFALAVQTTAVTAAIGLLMDKFPNFTEDLKKFAYTIGELPSQIVKGFKEGFDINSPSKVFEGIGVFCIQGFLIGIKDTLVEGIKRIATWLQDYIVTPICKFFGIASPSVLFAKLGAFLGEGLVNGFGDTLEKKVDGSIILTGIKNKLNGESFFNLGSLLGIETGDGILNGVTTALSGGNLSDALNLDNLSEGLSLDNLIGTDSMEGLDLSNLGTAIGDSIEDGVRGVKYSDLFTAEDLIDNEALYNEVKESGQTALVDAADEVKRHRDFIAMYPTFQDFLNDIDNNVAPQLAKAYHEGNDEVRSIIEAGILQNYIDQARLSADAYQYTKNAQIKAIKDAELEASKVYGPNKLKQDVEIETNFITSKGEFLKNVETAFANSNGKIELNLNNSSLGNNLNAVSNEVSSSINALAGELANKLDNLNKGVSTLDSNQASQNNEIVSGLGYLASAMNGMKIVLDSGALVGQITPLMDASLGERGKRKARG